MRVFFAQHGSRAVVLARFTPVVRCLAPALVGPGRMPRGRFTACNLLGAAGWGAALPLACHLLGGVALVAAHVELVLLAVVLLTVLPGLVVALFRRACTAHAPLTPVRSLAGTRS